MAHRIPPLPGETPRHGGAMAAASRIYGVPAEGWLDLSTGINPVPYPAAPASRADLAPLPDPERLSRLVETARRAYGAPSGTTIVPTGGSDIALRLLPLLMPRSRVAIVSPTYSGHGEAWREAGHDVVEAGDLAAALAGAPIVILANPNNPDGRRFTAVELASAAQDSSPGRRLIVDEAFCDLNPELSLIPTLPDSALVFRSFGKFYGLAGHRVGFLVGSAPVVMRLQRLLGDWPVSGPALAAAEAALADTAWQEATRVRLKRDRAALDATLAAHGFHQIDGTDLFRTVRTPLARPLHVELARQGVWTRNFDWASDRIRIGLPPPEGFSRWEAALASAMSRIG